MLQIGDVITNKTGTVAAITHIDFVAKTYTIKVLNPRLGKVYNTHGFSEIDRALGNFDIERLGIKHNKIVELLYAKQSN